MYKKILSWLLTFIMVFSMFGGIGLEAFGQSFNDIESHWAKAEIEEWSEKGLINGYSNGTFKPNDNITRAEFITLVNNVIYIQGEEEISFEDIDGSEWYYKELKKAMFGEYIGGYEDNTFRANDNITRQEVAVILKNLVQLNTSEEDSLEKFVDTENTPNWSRTALTLAVQKGYLTGYKDNTMKASNYITRAESVKVLSNVFGKVYNESGTYGPAVDEEVLEVKGNVTVSVEDVTLQNMVIDGDLYLAEGIDEGDVTLDNITVLGETIVKGGGENSIIIKNSSLSNLFIIKKDGEIRIVAQGSTTIDSTYLYSSGKLHGERLNKNSFGKVEIIRVTPGENIELEGSFTKIDVKVAAEIEINGKSKVEEINVHKDTENVNIFVSAYSIIDKLYAYTEINVNNRGVIAEALGEFAKTSNYENRLPVNLQPKTSSTTSRPSVDKYTLTLNANIGSAGGLSGNGSYEAGINITISAVAYEGYEFIEWKEGEEQITTAASFGYTTTSDNKTFIAYFESTSEFAGGSGTESDPYQVETADQLDEVRNFLDAHFIQIADIDLGVSPWNEGEGWEPIGNWDSDTRFKGSYNGNDFKISNLTINNPDRAYLGLFGVVGHYTTTSEIKNITINNLNISGGSLHSVGGLSGIVDSSASIYNCHTDGIISSESLSGYAIGGLIGSNNGTVINSSSSVNVSLTRLSSSYNNKIGGLAGDNSGTIEKCLSTGDVRGKEYVGGLVGWNGSGNILKSYSSSNVYGVTDVGGLVGLAWGQTQESYSTGSVSGTSNIGGLIGNLPGKVTNSYTLSNPSGSSSVGGLVGFFSGGGSPGEIVNCYANNLVTCISIYKGGLVASIWESSSNHIIENSYWDTETSGLDTSKGGTGYVTSAMIKSTNSVPIYEGWDFDTIWNIDEGSSYPYLRNNEQLPHPAPPIG